MMRHISFDTEGYRFSKKNPVPKVVVCSWYDGSAGWLSHPSDAATYAIFTDPSVILIGHNLPYDLLGMMRWHPWTIPHIIRMADEGRLRDTQIRECLTWLGTKGGRGYPKQFGLDRLVNTYLGEDRSALKKGPDSWRLHYGKLDGVPISDWPAEARNYALGDAEDTWKVAYHQGIMHSVLPTELAQVRGDLALSATSAWGFKVNPEYHAQLRSEVGARIEALDAEIGPLGWSGTGSVKRLDLAITQAYNRKQAYAIQAAAQAHGWTIWWDNWDYDVDVVRAVEEAMRNNTALPWTNAMPSDLHPVIRAKGFPQPKYTKRGYKSDAAVMKELSEVDPRFAKYTELEHEKKMMSTYIRPYEGGDVVHCHYTPMVTTGRTGCDGPNLQNIPRDGGFRALFMARYGYELGVVDYSALELVTLSATIRTWFPNVRCVLAEAIERGEDPHCITASIITGVPYAEIVAGKKGQYRDIRQGAKAANFGFPGGLQPFGFIPYAEQQFGVKLNEREAFQIQKGWRQAFPEVQNHYLAYAKQCCPTKGSTATSYTMGGRAKADCLYTQFANYPFQGVAADGAKESLYGCWRECVLAGYWRVQEEQGALQRHSIIEQYGIDLKDSPLNRSHPVNFVHDEIVMEHPSGRREALQRQEEIMVDRMSVTLNHKCPVGVEGQMSALWDH